MTDITSQPTRPVAAHPSAWRRLTAVPRYAAIGLALAAAPTTSPSRPSWAGGFDTILGWVAWFALGICVLGVIVAGGTMALASRRGEGGEHATRLGWVLAACVVIGSASTIVNAVLAAK